MKKIQFLNSFWIKIIALVSMVIDHIGAIILIRYVNDVYSIGATLYEPFRIIGRLSFVLISFLIIDGITYTKNAYKYLGRLFLLSIILNLGALMSKLILNIEYFGNPVTTIFLAALTIFLLKQKKYLKFLALIPCSLVILCDLMIIPFPLDYGIYGYFLIVGFYLCTLFVNLFMKYQISLYSLDEEAFITEDKKHTYRLVVSSIFLFTYNLAWYFIHPSWNGIQLMDMKIQIFSVFAIIPLLLYNGKRGYNKKWFKYGAYIFYPFHLIIIYLISYLI